jgi:hypothetical protein
MVSKRKIFLARGFHEKTKKRPRKDTNKPKGTKDFFVLFVDEGLWTGS